MLHVFHFVPALALTFLLKDFENSSSSFIAHRSSMNRLTVWYLYGSADFLEIRIGTCSDSKKKKKYPERTKFNTHRDCILFEHHISDSKITTFD